MHSHVIIIYALIVGRGIITPYHSKTIRQIKTIKDHQIKQINISEVWRSIKNYPPYEVSSLGNIRRVTINGYRILKPHINNNGYYSVVFSIKNKQFR